MVATGITVPVVVVLLIIIQLALPDAEDLAPLPRLGQRILPLLDVETPAVSPEIEAACTELITMLPLELDGQASRPIRASLPTAYAWGAEATVLRCGVPRPEGYVLGVGTLAISGVEWFFETAAPGTTFTAVDRGIYIEVFVPSSTDGGAPLAILAPIIVAALPYVSPTPG